MYSNFIYSNHSNFIVYLNLCSAGPVNAETCAATTNTISTILISCAAERYNQEWSLSYNVALYSVICYASYKVHKG